MESEAQLQPNDIDDATRLAATNRILTLAPMSENIVPDDEPDDLIAARHIIGPPIANIPSDEEVTSPTEVRAIEQKNHRLALSISGIIVVLLTVATGYLMLTK
jgi:hypothetical protein